MTKYLAGVLAILLTLAVIYGLWMRSEVADQKVEITNLTRERDNLKSELQTAEKRLEQSRQAHKVATRSLLAARTAARELQVIKDWINGNEDADIPAWFSDLLDKLGFSLREPEGRGSSDEDRSRRDPRGAP